MTERVMARVVRIDAVEKHPNADSLDICTVGGWRVVTKLGEYAAGDLAVFAEVDAWVPNELAPYLSKGKEPRVFNGVKGERLKTVRLRGELSQGLLLPFTATLADYAKDFDDEGQPFWMGPEDFFQEGQDVSEVLGIQKWEAPIPACLAGMMRGNFPVGVPRTDAERVQNLGTELQQWISDDIQFEVTIKLDGSSMTVTNINQDVQVCSRNLSLKLDQEGNSFVDLAKSLGLIEKLAAYDREIAIQGELIGPGIQRNQEQLSAHDFYVFEVYDVKAGKYLDSKSRRHICEQFALKHVPILYESVTLKELDITSIDAALKFAEGPSLNPKTNREGVVFKNSDGSIKWKAISNSWLLKNE